MSVLKVVDLSYTYSRGTPFSYDAIKNVNLDIKKGEIVGIIGHTGSGKSTLIQHINGLIKTTKGKIFLNGVDIWDNPDAIKEIRFKVGLVFQYPEYQLFDETVYDDISFGPKNMGLSEQEIKQRVFDAAKHLGIGDELLKKSPFDLSGGEKRRAAIAGVLAMQPEVLILDEPMAGLDPKGRDMLVSFIKQYRDLTGATILIVSHSMEDMAKIADKLLLMNQGEVVMFDTVRNVFSQAEMLVDIGLDIPEVTQIAIKLNRLGLKIDDNIFTVDELKNSLVMLKDGGNALA
ncbi:MAG: energy-coupling factor transporter ATPase [bacterium]|nr:energy-coupling factor transporter ATPase [bacterium]